MTAFYRVPVRVFCPGELPGKPRERGETFEFEGERYEIADFKADGSIVAKCKNPRARTWVRPEEWRL